MILYLIFRSNAKPEGGGGSLSLLGYSEVIILLLFWSGKGFARNFNMVKMNIN